MTFKYSYPKKESVHTTSLFHVYKASTKVKSKQTKKIPISIGVCLPGSRNDLASSPVNGLVGHHGIQDLKLAISDGLFAQWAFSRTPLKSLNNGVFDRSQEAFVNLGWQSVVHQDIGSFETEKEEKRRKFNEID